MTPEERSQALRREADEVLGLIHLREHCARVGAIVPTGSYFLDLMMYPDVDLYLPPTKPEELLAVGAALSKYDCVTALSFEKGGPGDLAEGLYLKPVIRWGSWGRSWKVDIWSLPLAVIEKKQAQLSDLKRRMTDEYRRRILDCKFRLLNAAGRTPMFSGIFLYRAIIDHGLTEFDQIVGFLKENGINVPPPRRPRHSLYRGRNKREVEPIGKIIYRNQHAVGDSVRRGETP